jgi:hypothetical protein
MAEKARSVFTFWGLRQVGTAGYVISRPQQNRCRVEWKQQMVLFWFKRLEAFHEERYTGCFFAQPVQLLPDYPLRV